MSRKVDMNNLSDEDIFYLQERGKRPADTGPIEVKRAGPQPLEQVTNTGDVGLPAEQSEAVFNGQGVDIEDNYDELDSDALKDEIRRRNEEQEDESLHMTLSGRKAELITRLREDDQRRFAAGELEEG